MNLPLKRILADVQRCSGCRLCEMVCSFHKEHAFASSTSRMIVIRDDDSGLDLPIVCWHCDPCQAIEDCPTEALERNKGGLVFVDEEKCVGCKKCSEACVIGAIRLHPTRNTPQICDLCAGNPLCVQKCPVKALTYMETEEQQPKSPNQVAKEILRKWGIID